MKIICDTLSFCKDNVPLWNTMSISGYHIREAGATAVQEVAFTMANAVAYIKAALAAGITVDSFAPRLSFFLASHNNFLEEIAKFRAARRIWARIIKKTFKAKNPLSWKFRFHTQTSGVTLVAQEPENNVIRVTLQALAAVLGGTQSLHTNSRDEAFALPSQESVRIALRTQQILAFESGVADTVDPLGGSYFLESLADQIEDKVNIYLQAIENMGGVLHAIESGYIQKEIQNSAYDYQKRLESKEQIIVGLNKFGQGNEKITFTVDTVPERVEKTQIKKILDLKANRSEKEAAQKLHSLEDAVKNNQNILPPMIEAVKARVTLGEISAALEKIYGTYRENPTI
jgi:methylmalonyl-CoA mutase N-terminal domain/subunit